MAPVCVHGMMVLLKEGSVRFWDHGTVVIEMVWFQSSPTGFRDDGFEPLVVAAGIALSVELPEALLPSRPEKSVPTKA